MWPKSEPAKQKQQRLPQQALQQGSPPSRNPNRWSKSTIGRSVPVSAAGCAIFKSA
jgi:hypothetical protein